MVKVGSHWKIRDTSNMGKNGFKKGHVNSPEARAKMSIAHKGVKLSEEHKRHISENNARNALGRPVSEETRRKIGLANSGRIPSIETRRKISLAEKGKITPPEVRLKMSLAVMGEKNHNWKGGITAMRGTVRRSVEYKLWRESVFARDKYTCVWCGKKGGWNKEEKRKIQIHADHIKPYAHYPELRFAIDNGRTLCLDCHLTTDTWGGNTR